MSYLMIFFIPFSFLILSFWKYYYTDIGSLEWFFNFLFVFLLFPIFSVFLDFFTLSSNLSIGFSISIDIF